MLGFLLGAGVAFLLQSSSATIGILQAIATTGALTFSSVYAIIIGVNIGDCVTTAIVCSIGSKADAKRTGVIHILFNIAGSILVIVGLMLLHSFGVLDALWDEQGFLRRHRECAHGVPSCFGHRAAAGMRPV